MRMKFIFLLCLTLTLSVCVLSQEAVIDSLKTYHLGEVVVTATRSEKNLSDIGRSVTLVTGKQLESSIYNNLSEVLSQQEGVYIVGTGQNPGMLQSVFMRGANNNHTTIMIDDVRITDPSAVNNALDLSELSLTNLDKLEIVRGTHSTLYGSSAIGGVINLITKKSEKPGWNANAELKTGTFGEGTSEFSENVFVNYTVDHGLYVNGEINNSNVKGLDATVDTITDLNVYKHRDKDGYDHTDFVGKIGFIDDRFDVYASYKRTNQNTDIDKAAYIDDDNYTIDFRRNLFTYGASYHVTENLKLKYIGGYSDMTRIAVDDSSVVSASGETDHTYSDGTWRGSTSTNEIQSNLKLRGFDGVLGGGFYHEAMGFKTYYYSRSSFGVYELKTDLDSLDPNTSTKNIFAHVDLNSSLIDETFDRVSIAVGARWYDHSIFGSKLTYEINPSLKINENALMYLSYSTGFNAPSLFQLYSPERDFVSDITRGNKNLKPETSSSFEFGIKQTVSSNLSFSANYFRTIVDDAIEYVYLWDKNIGIDTLGNDYTRNDFRGDTYLNLGSQTSQGIEFSVSSKISEQFYFSGNFSLVSGKLNYKPSDIDSAQTQGHHVQIYSNGAFIRKEVETLGLVRRPNTVNLSLTYKPIERLALRVDLRHVGSRSDIFYDSRLGPYGALGTVPVADYTLVDFSQKFDVDEHISIGARIDNIFDTKYAEINGFTTRGRGFYLNTRYSL
ncbi:MAG: TonB-dependent receptor [Ignavibacteriae bacterium]|nr:TonB-dependent receptor [Ignavibacteria bacterium]MBI3364153.1 TonB-dependent receptor [Ignavibacteriota bacterium]